MPSKNAVCVDSHHNWSILYMAPVDMSIYKFGGQPIDVSTALVESIHSTATRGLSSHRTSVHSSSGNNLHIPLLPILMMLKVLTTQAFSNYKLMRLCCLLAWEVKLPLESPGTGSHTTLLLAGFWDNGGTVLAVVVGVHALA